MLRTRLAAALERAAQVAQGPDAAPLSKSHPDLETEFDVLRERCRPFTMTSVERMYGLWQGVRHVVAHEVPGDIVECGVWRGGSSMLAGLTLRQAGDTHGRTLWLFDTFEGMSEPSEKDVSFDGRAVADDWEQTRTKRDDPVLAYASLEDVRANLAGVGLSGEDVVFVQGMVEDTIPHEGLGPIALLRLDTDWYESTRHELEHLWDRLEPGGVLIIDDYGHWAGARTAVDEFFAGRPDAPLLTRLDYTGRIGIKR